MPAVSAPAKVLVSGVNGYLGVWIARAFLEHGYTVRGTVRNISKAGSHLKTTFASYGPRFELVEVPDITAAGAFDEALGGIDIVAHTASPFILNIKEPSELIEPAIRGTVGILESIKRCGSSVKRVVLTSSVVAAVEFIFDGPRTFDDTTWNEQSINLVGDKGIDVGSGLVYSASKTLAEKAAWKFVEANKPSWDLVAINPSYVWGPLLQEVTSPETLNASMSLLLGALTGKLPDEQYTSKMLPVPFCDVRDVAEVHVHAAQLPQAGGTRAILRNSAGTPFLQDILDITNSLELETVEKLAKGKPGAVKDSPHPTTINVDQFERTYAYKLRSPEETLRDSLQELTQRGWIQ